MRSSRRQKYRHSRSGRKPDPDAAGHWAEQELRRWQDYGIVSGYPDGSLKPDRPLTRAEFIVLLDRVFGFEGGSEAAYKDVPDNAYYRKALAGASAAGIVNGTGSGLFMPDRPITREEAAKLIALAFDVEPGPTEAKRSSDAGGIAPWASASVESMLGRGYMNGRGMDQFAPKAAMTRAEMIKVLDNVVRRMIGAEGLSDATVQGNVVVNRAPVRLQNLVVEGDLILAPGIRTGEVSLDHVTVSGRVLVQGSPDSGIAIRDSQLAVVQLASPKTKLSLTAVKIDRLRMLPSAAGSIVSQDEATSIGQLDNAAQRVEFRKPPAAADGTTGSPSDTGGGGQVGTEPDDPPRAGDRSF
ncbi:S-layer homology domain-containing protein [Cohnella rhizosphaerae]|uniref:S-layer homology domain-containing protein n=1 Tax=Cohnella rhizosphaerae TaxID=1457232 RepID=A0A9X4KQ31_9BACL|nr:S-layer homology domain-containing protein [Cohnella rhizosphaerae]MDG0808156.1 S-layer homology domain-containing protein [Cohnella rhizosphaerae]